MADGEVVIDITADDSDVSQKLSGVSSKAGKLAKAAGAAIAAGLAVAGTAIVSIGKKAIEAYAEYEQLVGGVETLFGANGAKSVEEYAAAVGKTVDEVRSQYDMLMEAQTTVMNNASQAYKTAGMSANEYMNTVTSFAAALKQSTANEVEAAQVADMAVVDMADNAAKMGTSMELVQNAYQGFAKQNYTMLDNLKLGYGGTKTEMERLLADAEELSGVEYNIDSLSDVYEAIHVIQTELGITGTTAAEAMATLEGSANMTKAAWENLLVGLADPSQDLTALTDNLITSITAFADNLVERIQALAPRMGEAFSQLAQNLMPYVSQMLDAVLPAIVEAFAGIATAIAAELPNIVKTIVSVLPQIMDAGIQIIEALGNGLVNALPQLIPAAAEAITTIIEGMANRIDELVNLAIQLVIALAQGISNALPILISAVPQIIEALVQGIIDNLPQLLALGPVIIGELVAGILEALGFDWLADKARDAVDQFTDAVYDKSSDCEEAGRATVESLDLGISGAISDGGAEENGEKLMDGFLNGVGSKNSLLESAGSEAANSVKKGVESSGGETLLHQPGASLATGLKNGVESKSSELVTTGTSAANSVKKGVESGGTTLLHQPGVNMMTGFKTGIESLNSALNTAGVNATASVKNGVNSGGGATALHQPGVTMMTGFKTGVGSKNTELNIAGKNAAESVKTGASGTTMTSTGSNLMAGFVAGVKSKVSEAVKAAQNAVTKIKAAFTGAQGFSIHSPSRWALEQGKYLMEGLINGITQNTGKTVQKAQKAVNEVKNAIATNVEQLEKQIAEIEAREEEKSAEEKIKSHKESIDKLYEEKKKATLERQEEIDKEIAEAEAEFQDEQQKEALKSQKEHLEDIQDAYEDAADEILEKQDDLKDKLADYGDLFTTNSKTDKIELANIDKQIDTLEQYSELLDTLKDSGISNDFMEAFLDLDVDEALEFGQKLLENEGELQQYVEKWERQQELANQIATSYYQEELDTIETEFAGKLDDALASIPEQTEDIGEDTVMGMVEGMQNKEGILYDTARELAANTVEAMKDELDIHSPSKKLAALVGEPAAAGVEVGFVERMKSATEKMRAAVAAESFSDSNLAMTRSSGGSSAAAEVKTYYNNVTTERTPVIKFEGNLSELARVLKPHIDIETKRLGISLANSI